MATYTTMQGDMWDSIAYMQLGSCDYVGDLMLKNQAYLDYYFFPAGIVLTLPEISKPAPGTAPPWKQVSA